MHDAYSPTPPPEIVALREALERRGDERPMAAGVLQAPFVHRSPVPVAVFRAVDPPPPLGMETVVFLIHGGGFWGGSVHAYAEYASRLAGRLRCTVYVPEYPLAPEHPFPEAFDAVRGAYLAVVAALGAGTQVVLAGDSAGGGLAAGLSLDLAASGRRVPDALVVVSPWVDLRNRAQSFLTNAASETVFSLAAARQAAAMYLAGHDPADPRVSPLFGDWRGQPPMFVGASTSEALRDDADGLAAKARERGVAVTQRWYPGARHGWQLDYPPTGQAAEALEDVAAFVSTIRRAHSAG